MEDRVRFKGLITFKNSSDYEEALKIIEVFTEINPDYSYSYPELVKKHCLKFPECIKGDGGPNPDSVISNFYRFKWKGKLVGASSLENKGYFLIDCSEKYRVNLFDEIRKINPELVKEVEETYNPDSMTELENLFLNKKAA